MSRIVRRAFDVDHPVLVVEEDGVRSLDFGSGIAQSCMDPSAPERLCLAYTRRMMLALTMAPSPERVLALGLGGGSIPRFLLHHYPSCHVDAVERSAVVVETARHHFLLPAEGRLTVLTGDAADFVSHATATAHYQLIFVDLFEPEAMAAPLYDESFHAACRGLLDMGGILCVNLWSGDRRRHRLALDALTSGCGHLPLLLPVAQRSNIIAFAADSAPALAAACTRARACAPQVGTALDLPLSRYCHDLRLLSPPSSLQRLFEDLWR